MHCGDDHVNQLFVEHADLVRRFIRALVRDRERAADVFQETYLTMLRKSDDYEPGTSFPKWICAIARFKVMEAFREHRRLPDSLSPDVIETLAGESTAHIEDPRLDRLEDCLRRLSGSMLRLLRHRYQEDLKTSQIAERMNWTPNAVSVGLSRARAQLRQCINNPGPNT